MRKALAVARVTIAESVRRKALFFLVVLWGLWAVFGFALPGVEAGHRVQLAFAGNLQATSFFAIVLAICLVSTSIPRDYEEKRIFLVLTKPVRTWDFFFGKFLGYAAFFAVVLGASAAVLAALVAFTFRDLTPEEKEAHFYARRLLGAESLEVSTPGEASGESPTEDAQSLLVDDRRPQARWRFARLDPERLPPGPVQGRLGLRFQPARRAIQPGDRAAFGLRIVDPDSGRSRLLELEAVRGRPVNFEFPRELVGARGEVDLIVERTGDEYVFLVSRPDVVLHRSREHFAWNLGKAILVAWFESLVVIAIGLLASAFLSGPVAVLFSAGLVIVGHCLEHLRTAADRLTSPAAVQDMWATITGGHVHGGPAPEATEPSPVLEAVQSAVQSFCSVFPDFARFSTSDLVGEGISLGWVGLGRTGLYAALYAALFLAAGWILLATSDVDRREGLLARSLTGLGRLVHR